MIVYIKEDEWYPVFTMSPEGGHNYGYRAEIPAEEYARYKKAMATFDQFQERMVALKTVVEP